MRCIQKIFIIILLIVFLSVPPLSNVFGARLSGDSEISGPASQSLSTDNEAASSAPVSPGSNVQPSSAAQENRNNPAAAGRDGNPSAGNTGEEFFKLDLKDVDIRNFIELISDITGKNFVPDNAVRGNVTIISPTGISAKEAYRVFESVLDVHGFATVPSGDIIKIVPAALAPTKRIDTIIDRKGIRPDDRVVTQIIPLKYASPEELRKVFQVLIPKTSVIVAYEPTGMLIVTDVLSNITRLLEIIEAIDIPGTGEVISVLPLYNASAEIMANSLGTVFRPGAAGRTPQSMTQITIVPDKRTNSLVVLASEIDTLKVKELLNLLDREIPHGEGDIHVYYLQNANAENLAKTLMAIPARQGQTEQIGTTPALSKDIQIVADSSTNSLVISAKKEEYAILDEVIKKLDIPRKMVYIEALIMEVSMAKEHELGVQWLGGQSAGHFNDRPINVFSSSSSGANLLPSVGSDGIVSLPSGFTLGVLGDTIQIGGIEFPSIGAVVRAYATDSDVQILSTPQVMTMDNEEAEIRVVDNIPFITRRDTSSDFSSINYSNYEFKDVGVVLKITPQINQERFVRLNIEQEVSQVVSTDERSGQPTTLKREAKTTVSIQDGQTVVIGGLIDETDHKTKYKVPVLGSIPLVGRMFRSQSNSLSRKNLYIFITPHIIDNPAEAKAVYDDKKGHIEAVKEGAIRMYQGRRGTRDVRLSDLGYRHLRLRDYDRALDYFQKSLDENPENAHALFNSGYIHVIRGDIDMSADFFRRLIELDPPDRMVESVDPFISGRKLTDVAAEYLKELNYNEAYR